MVLPGNNNHCGWVGRPRVGCTSGAGLAVEDLFAFQISRVKVEPLYHLVMYKGNHPAATAAQQNVNDNNQGI